jgi:hypothetical protein
MILSEVQVIRARMHNVSRQKLWVKTTDARTIWCRPQGALSRSGTITRVYASLAQCSEPIAIGCRPAGLTLCQHPAPVKGFSIGLRFECTIIPNLDYNHIIRFCQKCMLGLCQQPEFRRNASLGR